MSLSSSSSASSGIHDDDVKRKMRIRRVKANGRERARMHGLNQALDVLREYIPITTQHQKLSKIETLRLAKNYIEALNRMLQTNSQPSPLEYAHQLATGLSQTTTNMLANLLQVQPRLLCPPQQFDHFDLPTGYPTNPSSASPSATSFSSPTPQYYYSPNPSAAPLQSFPPNSFYSDFSQHSYSP
ncbi:unnamed protein product [Caenorhabditis bovis]|uniref:BHLH domain-containing protein n=1 Tax=Caenorhabditis bovis TaxID=2654633 RepID=A0A8S1ENM1_9PELO|nr:unnamed protein product [Caenorhabditis bovis]